ncbi:response regulator transcription factor [Marmoricola sp. URHB0036]|uniref:response regulator transcription factor n=1 Tax=Marmoricola sp. URHB0036 TaxID=1298863 RepID=UPI0003F896D2|nr:response regulator transcription factor [Marmoricola sp. URHB0036]
MGVLDDLAQARSDYERADWVAALDTWSAVDRADLTVEDLCDSARSAYLLGRRDDAIDRYQQAFRLCEDQGDLAAAVVCAFQVAMTFATTGEPAMAGGWTSRAERLLDELGPDPVGAGYVTFLHMFRALGEGELETAVERADVTVEIGRRHGERDLVALGLTAGGRVRIYAGRAVEGLALLDEAMAAAASGDVSPEVLGNVYCIAIEGCQDIAAFDRVAEWTSALHRWCTSHPGLVAFTGQCSVHRGQVMRQRGAWDDALEEFGRAAERYRLAHTLDAIGQAEGERGDVFRLQGEYAAAEAAYQRAGELGFEAQPGLALLWLSRGSREAAAAAVRRLVAEVRDPVGRCRMLPAAVDVLLAVGAIDEARSVAELLEEVAASTGSAAMTAFAAYGSGAVELASGDPAGALPYLRKARQLWGRAEAPYEVGRVRLLTGRALTALGDEESGRQELEAARDAFVALGAKPMAEEAASYVEPTRLPGGLTAREVEVLRLVASGRSNPQIAADLTLSEKTVARHLSNIFGKLEVGSRTAAAAYAYEHGLV